MDRRAEALAAAFGGPKPDVVEGLTEQRVRDIVREELTELLKKMQSSVEGEGTDG